MSKAHNSAASRGANGLTFVSLYSGAGGLDLGFARAGFTPVFANDIDPYAVQTYTRLHEVRDPEWREAARRFEGHAAVCGDVRVAAAELEAGMADLVIGGPPCQGFSVAGRMDPNDPRSRHVFDFLGLVATVKPRAFVMENVAALARNRRWADIIANLQDMAALDYKIELIVLNASHWGVPQARERMFLVGVPHDGPDFALPEPPTIDAPPTVRSTLSLLPRAGEPGNDSLCTAIITLAKSPVLRRSPYAGMLFNGQGRAMGLDRPAPTLPASMGGNRTPIVDEGDLYDGEEPWIVDYHRRLFVEGKNPLAKLPPEARLRRITVEEAAAIQTFPKDVPWQGAQSARFRQIGNAVPPRLAYQVAAAVADTLLPTSSKEIVAEPEHELVLI
ncbi:MULTISPECIES: DNA cytosine methyltransferase [Rhodococcus]|uniref:DNA cytosine methyltransferase n=1 Tax=Rhodococcus TaxID=1827 RepID=UPI001E5E7BFF|nr:DNA cytosine methyltransferase [Rhodococcus pyridinivorans]MCD2118327.1 DNA cytosine methyltransferase [Rhodococcus pyridinivorans]MCZ4627246.1 DNA cytosine methyltransferase [Rhodococcus pyridinivorans]MCZ4648438.1 DNA cytosine methyltransferase [Rhodococcus pyridinivorans]MDJ0481127.1 DNA cytosine methyltransferase [Rhodococcus pyridinivorans]MDV7254593.1 DNA cytosine methyltransferase [Rhodococcus pyridinivorans]